MFDDANTVRRRIDAREELRPRWGELVDEALDVLEADRSTESLQSFGVVGWNWRSLPCRESGWRARGATAPTVLRVLQDHALPAAIGAP